jgi:GT2 family glycosyltransferase
VPGPAVSIVTVTFEAAAFVEPFLASIAALRDPDLEIVIVDNASRDGTPERIRGALPRATLVEPGRNLGFGGGSNLGAARARGDVLLFLNPDTVVPPDVVERLCVPVWERPRLGVAGCKLVFPDGRLQSAGGVVGANGHCRHRGWGEVDRGQYDVETGVDYVPGAALAIRRALFLEIGGFWEGYFPGFYDDTELCLRVRARGYEVRYLPRPVVVHLESPSMSRARAYWMTRNRLLFLARNQPLTETPATVARELRALARDGVRPLVGALVRCDPARAAAAWRGLAPVLAGTLVAAARGAGARWRAGTRVTESG